MNHRAALMTHIHLTYKARELGLQSDPLAANELLEAVYADVSFVTTPQ
jgi:hypothetical protein